MTYTFDGACEIGCSYRAGDAHGLFFFQQFQLLKRLRLDLLSGHPKRRDSEERGTQSNNEDELFSCEKEASDGWCLCRTVTDIGNGTIHWAGPATNWFGASRGELLGHTFPWRSCKQSSDHRRNYGKLTPQFSVFWGEREDVLPYVTLPGLYTCIEYNTADYLEGYRSAFRSGPEALVEYGSGVGLVSSVRIVLKLAQRSLRCVVSYVEHHPGAPFTGTF